MVTVGGIAVSAGYTVLVKTAPLFDGLNWAGALLVGIGLAIATGFAVTLLLAVGAYAFRRIWPLPATPSAPSLPMLPGVDHNPTASTMKMSKIEERLNEVETKSRAIIDDYQTVLGRHAKQRDRMDALEKETRRLEALQSLTSDETAEKFNSIYQSLLAVFYRERLLKLADSIEDRSEWLLKAIEGGQTLDVIDWAGWQSEEKAWRADVDAWCTSAGFYVPDAKDQIERPDQHVYEKGAWRFREEQFPIHEGDPFARSGAVHKYKTYRIAAGRWMELKDKVHDVVRKVAFEGHHPPHWQESSK